MMMKCESRRKKISGDHWMSNPGNLTNQRGLGITNDDEMRKQEEEDFRRSLDEQSRKPHKSAGTWDDDEDEFDFDHKVTLSLKEEWLVLQQFLDQRLLGELCTVVDSFTHAFVDAEMDERYGSFHQRWFHRSQIVIIVAAMLGQVYFYVDEVFFTGWSQEIMNIVIWMRVIFGKGIRGK
eukprot:TRINITY_DN10191_c0_g1_i1.p1 TRINITY_DN10191_c0_g1~~TRINITY_DN10191_c0_g1_i1.p1  ORF type:complete len:179 (-),score=42.79 TRINITY_DN10191_c0_g1_i1:138-674(-)